MSNPKLVFLREQIFFIERLLEDCQAHIHSLDENPTSRQSVRQVAEVKRLQNRAQALLDDFTVAENSFSYVN